ncbi:MAG: J domain-containing protein [Halanaerobium sp.]
MNVEELNSKKVYQAAQTLNLRKKESMAEIKKKHRQLIKKWHPDQCQEKPEICGQKIKEINEAFKIIKKYCSNYLYSFAEAEILENLPREIQSDERLRKQFGSDPLWG